MTQPSLSEQYPLYYKSVAHLDEVDVYQVHHLFGLNDPSGCVHHASKKLLLAGQRNGGKPALKDIQEARDSLNRYLQINSVAALLAPPLVKQAANDEKPVEIKLELVPLETAPAVEEKKFVVLFYFHDESRRFKPRKYFAIAQDSKGALKHFKRDFPGAESVWIEEVHQFMTDSEKASRKYWASR